MSGGFFDYKDQLIDEILYKLRLEIALSRRKPDWTNEWSNYSEDFIREMGKVYNMLVEARARLHCIDWVLSGVISEDTYHQRLSGDLRKIELDSLYCLNLRNPKMSILQICSYIQYISQGAKTY